jgi:hypothetical protein
MKIQPINIVLATINLALLLFLLSRAQPAAAQNNTAVLRGSALELVDAQDQVRTRINVEPSGEVVLRLLDQQGTIRVKLGASTEGSGLTLLNDATEPGVQILAQSDGSSIKLRNKDGKEHTITP